MRVLFVTHSLAGGGAERVLVRLANEFIAAGYSTTVFSFQNRTCAYILNSNINVVYPKGVRCSKFQILSDILSLRYCLKRHDAAICMGYSPCFRLFFSSLFLHKRIIMSERNNPKQNITSKLKRLFRQAVYCSASHVVFQTEEALNSFWPCIQKKASIIENPIDDDIPQKTEWTHNGRFIAAGRLDKQKNFPMMINAFIEFAKENTHDQLEIYGDGLMRNELEKMIQENQVADRVHLMGYSDKIYEKMVHSDVFLSSSNYEGVSNSMLEAMAIGLPVVVTDTENHGERMFIQDGFNGFLVKMGDSFAMCEAMQKLTDCSIAKKLGINAMKVRERCSVKIIAKKWMRVL